MDLMTGIIENMTVKPDRMRRNIDMTHGLVFSPRVMLALVEAGVERGEAYDAVQRAAMQALRPRGRVPGVDRTKTMSSMSHLDR